MDKVPMDVYDFLAYADTAMKRRISAKWLWLLRAELDGVRQETRRALREDGPAVLRWFRELMLMDAPFAQIRFESLAKEDEDDRGRWICTLLVAHYVFRREALARHWRDPGTLAGAGLKDLEDACLTHLLFPASVRRLRRKPSSKSSG